MNEEIINQLRKLKLDGMINEFERQSVTSNCHELPFYTRLQSMIGAELTHRNNKRLQLLLKKSKLKGSESIHAIDYSFKRGLNADLMLSLTSLDWISQHQNICLTGPAGIGKTWIACALGYEACLTGIPTLFHKVRLLLDALYTAKLTGTFNNILLQINKFPVLILDDWAIEPFNSQQQSDLFELIDSRHLSHSTIITSQLSITEWHDAFPNKNLADAILDRLISTTYRIELAGESMRVPRQ